MTHSPLVGDICLYSLCISVKTIVLCDKIHLSNQFQNITQPEIMGYNFYVNDGQAADKRHQQKWKVCQRSHNVKGVKLNIIFEEL